MGLAGCAAIQNATSLDVIEMDAASHTGLLNFFLDNADLPAATEQQLSASRSSFESISATSDESGPSTSTRLGPNSA